MFQRAASTIAFLSCVLLVAGHEPPLQAQPGASTIEQHFAAAHQAEQEGHLDTAAHEYEAILTNGKGIAEVYANLGLVYYSQSRFQESAEMLITARRLKPSLRGVSLWLGINDVRLHRAGNAVPLLREAARVNPKDKLALSWLGTALWDSGHVDEALVQFRAALSQYPNDRDLLFALGEAYGKAAEEEIEDLVSLTTGTALSDIIYGSIYDQDRDWLKAEGHLRRAIARDPQSWQAHVDLAQVLFEQDKLAEARQQLDAAVAVNPGSASAAARYGELLLLLGHFEEGLEQIRKALERNRAEALDSLNLQGHDAFETRPANSQIIQLSKAAARKLEESPIQDSLHDIALAALYNLACDADKARSALGKSALPHVDRDEAADLFAQAMNAVYAHDNQTAETKLLRWLTTHPKDLNARFQLVRVRRRMSADMLAQLITVAPDSYQVHQMLGQLYVRQEEDEKALAEYRAVVSTEPDLPGVHFWLGHLYWKRGDAEQATKEFRRELAIDPEHPESNAELGAILVAEDKATEAIPLLQLALKVKHDLWPVYAQLGRAYALQKDYLKAEAVLQEGLAHDIDGSVHYQLALALRDQGKSAPAARLFSQVQAINRERLAADNIHAAGREEMEQ